MTAHRTDPDIAVVTEDDRRSTRQVVEVSLATFYQRTRNINQNTLTQLHTTLTYTHMTLTITGLQKSRLKKNSVQSVFLGLGCFSFWGF